MFKKYAMPVLTLLIVAYFGGRYLYFQPKYDDGIAAPDFSSQLADGTDFKLSDLQGDYVLLDFWGSWCGPCRAESPQLTALYRQYKDAKSKEGQGFKVVSVAVERNERSWQRAIEADQLNWPHHVLDASTSLKFFNGPIASLYGIAQVPTHYLIDPAGRIIASDPSLDEVAAVLEGALTN